ncbi:MAG TPA: SH3 domain-containing protein [Candidatus Dormibacteraeota bacterium]|nr:SH3 domain-containing protein [Candidatus Dormibacteraeota bacterium]
MRVRLALAGATVAMVAGCALPGQKAGVPAPSPSVVAPSPSPSAFLRAVWVLSPIGVNLREGPDRTAKVLNSVPQGTQVTATGFSPGDPGWYQVTFNGQAGWIAAKGLTSVHPQLAYASSGAGYYLLYPSGWQVTDRGADVEIVGAGGSQAPAPGASAAIPAPTGPRVYIHEGKDVDSVGNTPTSAGSVLSRDQVEVYGITTLEAVYSLTGGGVEADVRLKLDGTHAVLINFRSNAQADLATFTELLESFGVSLAQPSPSP